MIMKPTLITLALFGSGTALATDTVGSSGLSDAEILHVLSQIVLKLRF